MLELAWLSQPGRVVSKTCVAAEGFRAKPPYASVTLVAECAEDDHECVAATTAAIRDTFAEGVAHGIGEALRDAFDRVSEAWGRSGHERCSAAAVAAMGGDAWVAVIGSCHAFMTDRGSEASVDIHPREEGDPGDGAQDRTFRMRKIILREGQSILLATRGLRKLMGSSAASRYTSDGRETLSSCLRTLVRETRIQFRKRGGAVAAARFVTARAVVPWRRYVLPAAAGLAAIAATVILFGIFGGRDPDGDGTAAALPADDPVVMPLEPPAESLDTGAVPDTVSVLFIPGISPSLEGVGAMRPGSSGAPPDERWENAPGGVYYLQSDTVASELARRLADSAVPPLEAHPLGTVIVVRQDAAAAFSSWLRTLPADRSASTAVIVEAGSSVAGGASWIRDFAVFANGDRGMTNLQSGFCGDSLPGLPARRDPEAYPVIVIL